MSIVRNYSKTGSKCRVTFKLNATQAAAHAALKVELAGDFNDWGKNGRTTMKLLKDGSFSATLTLESGKEYLFKYVVNDTIWENDDQPDAWVPDGNGGDNSLIKVAVPEA